MDKRLQLQKSAIPYVTRAGGGAGCDESLPCSRYCWAKGLAGGRLAHLPQYQGLIENGRWTGKLWEDPEFCARIATRKKSSVIGFFFMGDCALASEEFLRQCFEAFAESPQHQIVVLTKRWPLLMKKLGMFTHKDTCYIHRSEEGFQRTNEGGYSTDFLLNVWVGVSASYQATYDERVSALCDPETGWPGQKFASIEPCMGRVDLGQWASQLGWCIAGSSDTLAHGAAALTPEIARTLQDQCREAGVPFWLKQGTRALDPLYYGTQEPFPDVMSSPLFDGATHLDAPEPIAAILRERNLP